MNHNIQFLSGWRVSHAMDGAFQDCSLVLATYRRPKEVVILLETMIGLKEWPMEVIIVDGASDEETELAISDCIKTYSLRFDLVYVKSPKGLTKQRNVGIDLASREYVFFLDDDCLPQPGFFREIRKIFSEDLSKKIGAVCGLNINEVDRPLSRSWRFRQALGLLPKLDGPKIYHPAGVSLPIGVIKPFSGVKRVDILNGNAMAFRKEVFAEAKFSEYFCGYSLGEDVEMSLRIGRKWQIWWCGDSRVIHNHASGGRPASFAHGLMQVRNRVFIRNRHFVNSTFKDNARFWLDILYAIFLDVGRFLRSPWQPYFLLHALGLIWGLLICQVSPPLYEEPIPTREYELVKEN